MFADAGREGEPTVAFTPPSMLMTRTSESIPSALFVDEAGQLAAAGVSALTVSFPARSRRDFLAAMDRFASEVIPQLH